MSSESIDLFELNQYVQQVIELNFSSEIWVKCEFSNLKNSRGNYYVDLVQKDHDSDRVIAKAQGIIWRSNVEFIEKTRKISLSEMVQTGVEVKILISMDFHALYGLKYVILDIDSDFTIGRLELKRRETINKVKSLNLDKLNKSLGLSICLQRIAVISSDTAAGYIDFVNELENNSYGFHFDVKLFKAALQGEKLLSEMLKALDKIEGARKKFDVVVIIRGGGSKLDLAGFDTFELAERISKLSLPVLTGIGHEIDISVADLVSYRSFKTPTAVATFLIENNLNYSATMHQLISNLSQIAQDRLVREDYALSEIKHQLNYNGREKIEEFLRTINAQWNGLEKQLNKRLAELSHELAILMDRVESASPKNILNQGYSIIQQTGKRIRSKSSLNLDKDLEVIFHDGKVLAQNLKDEKEKFG